MSKDEQTYLHWFKLRIASSVAGWFGSRFWALTVLPALSTEPAILHAAVALSAAHSSCDFGGKRSPDVHERFILQQYSKAIHHLQSAMLHNDRASITIVLITCQLFTFLEYLRGRSKTAETHLRSGLKLLRDMHSSRSVEHFGVTLVKASPLARATEVAILESFATLHIQVDLFGRDMADMNILLQPMQVELPQPTFSNAQDARGCLDKILHGILLISQRLRTVGRDTDDYARLVRGREGALSQLDAWHEIFAKTFPGFEKSLLVHGHVNLADLPCSLLLNYHTMASIMCKGALPLPESTYAAFTADFVSILESSVILFNAYSSAQALPESLDRANTIVEFGWIPPLYYTAIKCRVSRIRRHAIRLLDRVSYKEGIWDSLLAASVARKVMELEEQDAVFEGDMENDIVLDEVLDMGAYSPVTLPESSLFHDVHVEMRDEAVSRARLTCRRWRPDESLEVIQCCWDGEIWVQEHVEEKNMD